MIHGDQVQDMLNDSLYSISIAGGQAIADALNVLDERISTLRSQGTLTVATLKRYYGDKRYEQVAESNAIEGSTLSIGETELAILKGTTLTGHDPAFVRDAIALDRALTRLTEMAKTSAPTDIQQVKELHELIMEGRDSAGAFRSSPVILGGSEHRPPKTWQGVMSGMEAWERWSLANANAPALMRAAVLHAWFTNVHPFSDGNGRTARAISNLELIRVGYPPIIIRKIQDRDRYLNALQESDSGGNIGPFFDLVHGRARNSLIGLEHAAREAEGYDPAIVKLRKAQANRLEVWNTAVELLYRVVVDKLSGKLDACGGRLESRVYMRSVNFEDYLELCLGRAVSRSWAFSLRAVVPALGTRERLAWVGFRTQGLRASTGRPEEQTPSLFWSTPNPDQYPPWISATPEEAPAVLEFSVDPGTGDAWHVRTLAGQYRKASTSELATMIADGFVDLLSA